MHRMLKFIVLASAAASLAACAGSGAQPRTLEGKLAQQRLILGEQVRGVSNYRLNSWRYLDDQHVVIESGINDHYLVTLRTWCEDLRGAVSIGFRTNAGRLTDYDSLVVSGPGATARTCMIDTLHELVRVREPDDNG